MVHLPPPQLSWLNSGNNNNNNNNMFFIWQENYNEYINPGYYYQGETSNDHFVYRLIIFKKYRKYNHLYICFPCMCDYTCVYNSSRTSNSSLSLYRTHIIYACQQQWTRRIIIKRRRSRRRKRKIH